MASALCRLYISVLIFMNVDSEPHCTHAETVNGQRYPIWQARTSKTRVDENTSCFSRHYFLTSYIKRSVPVVMRGAASHWPATKFWGNLSYMAKHHGHNEVTVEFIRLWENGAAPKDFVKTMPFKTFLGKYQSDKLAVDSLINLGSTFTQDLILPSFLDVPSILTGLLSLNLLFLNLKYSPYLYQESDDKMVILHSGTKTFTLYNKSYGRYLRGVGDDESEFSFIDPLAVDERIFGKLRLIPQFEVQLRSGDILFIPKYWWQFARHYGDPNVATVVRFKL